MARAHNFSAGPAALPTAVLERLPDALLEFGGTGAGIMEISHRSKAFSEVNARAQERLRRILGIPADYTVMFLQGGATQQFAQLVLNLLEPDEAADYLETGNWSVKAIKDAARLARCENRWSSAEEGFRSVPQQGEYTVRDEALFLHYTTNNTVYGTQYRSEPDGDGKPLVADMSSDICSRPVDVARHGLIYAGAQKNLGPSGVTAVILSPWALERSQRVVAARGDVPTCLQYGPYAKKDGLYNTPNTWGIHVLDLVLGWIEDNGGLEQVAATNTAKAEALYGEIDRTGFWTGHARPDSRSQMNVTFTLPSEELTRAFIEEADAQGLKALKGYRTVGGIRASLYNAVSKQAVDDLVAFMRDFEGRHG